jgi:integrase
VFRQILAQALADGWIKTNVAARVKNPVPAAAEVETFADWPTVEAIALELGTGPDGGAILITGVGTGARPEELFGLNWSDVDLAGRTITLRRVYTRGVLSAEMKTSGSRRTIPLAHVSSKRSPRCPSDAARCSTARVARGSTSTTGACASGSRRSRAPASST